MNFQKNPLRILKIYPNVSKALKKLFLNNHSNIEKAKNFIDDYFSFLMERSDLRETDPKQVLRVYERNLKNHPSLKKFFTKDMFLQMIESEAGGVESVLDFGCGKLAFLKNMAEKNKDIKEMIGIDSKSKPDLEKLDSRIKFKRNLAAVKNLSADLVVVKLVLHHLAEGEIIEKLKDIKRILKPSGRLIVFEETFPERVEGKLEISKRYLNELGMEVASEVTDDFLSLPREEKRAFLFLNDWLINLQNASYMPWTLEYKSMEEWQNVVESVGFVLKRKVFLGAIVGRKRKQGMTGMFVFAKN